jgi:hypothetical protein
MRILITGGMKALATNGPIPPRFPRNRTPSHVTGVPAITPRTQSTPAFTVEDVRAYYQTNPFHGGPTVSGTPPTIVSIKFITSQQARTLMGDESVSRPDGALVCYVELLGPFFPTCVSVPPGQALPATVDGGVEVFDVQTGNLLVWGLA